MSTRPFAPFEWFIAARYLRARRREGFISVIAGFSFAGILLGVATLIIVMSVMNGFRAQLFDRILGLNGHALIQAYGENLTGYDEVAARLREVPGVTRAVPMVEGQVLAQSDRAATGALVRGLRPDDLRSLELVADNIKTGSLLGFGEPDTVILGARLADRLGVGLGDKVTLLSPRGVSTPFGTAPRVKAYYVGGTFAVGMSEYDSSFVFMPLDEAQLYFRMPEAVSALEVMVEQPYEVRSFREALSLAAGPSYRVIDWQQVNAGFFNALVVEKNVMFLILSLIVLIAALNIISGLIMLVKDKGADIAILRTMGASQGAVMRIFFIAGASIGLAGTLFGFVLGVVFCDNIETIRQAISWLLGTELFSPEIYFLSQLPADMQTRDVVTVVAMSIALSFLATLYPSWRAARLDPVEALRYE